VLDVSTASLSSLQVINTLESAKLKKFIDEKVAERRSKIYDNDKSKISILPQFKKAIEQSKQVSSKLTVDA
jgi:hypothetical protein